MRWRDEAVVQEFQGRFASHPIIAALDDMGSEETLLRTARALHGPGLGALKVNTLLGHPDCGVQIIGQLGAASVGTPIFADIKIKDIPNTAASWVRNLRLAGARIITVHIDGGRDMLLAAIDAATATDGLCASLQPALILGVTVLTSLNDRDCRSIYGTGIPETEPGCAVRGAFLRMADIGVRAGIHGLVMSPKEVELFREAHRDYQGVIVTPGIRPTWYRPGGKDDQRRVATPAEAISYGADALVVGRPLFEKGNPSDNLRRIHTEITAVSRRGAR